MWNQYMLPLNIASIELVRVFMCVTFVTAMSFFSKKTLLMLARVPLELPMVCILIIHWILQV